MGIFFVKCPTCDSRHQWFSGILDQRCLSCRNKENIMDHEQAHLDALNKVILIQSELILYLKAEIERLKLSQIYINAPTSPFNPINPVYPYVNPQPFVPTQPGPLGPPYVVTCGDTTSVSDIAGNSTSFTGTGLPVESVKINNNVDLVNTA